MLLQYYSVLQSTALYYKVLLYYSVLQSTTPVLLRTTKYYCTKYYSSTTSYHASTTLNLYYKLLLQYYSVLESTTPVLLRTAKFLLRTTKNYPTTSLYHKVLYSSTTPLQCGEQQQQVSRSNLTKYTAPATQKDSHASSSSHMKRHLQCTQQQTTSSNTAPATQKDPRASSSSHI